MILWKRKKGGNRGKCCLGSFSGRSRRGYLKFPSLGSPHAGKVKKNTHWKDPRRGKIRGPGQPGLRMAMKFFEIEMQRTCTHVTQTNKYICQLLFADLVLMDNTTLSPFRGPLSRTKINLRCGRPPHAKRGEYLVQWEIPCT